MSASVLEQVTAALVTALNTGRPAGVPAIERDRWVDVDTGPEAWPACSLSGYEEEPRPNQNEDRPLDFRRVRLSFEIYAAGSDATTPSQEADVIAVWIARQCGPTGAGALASAGVVRIEFEKRMAIVGKGNHCRCLVQLRLEYRNVVTDITRAK